MEKEFVPYELALKIKQIGYKKEGVDEDCFAFYDEEEYLFTVREQDDINEEWLIAPTFSQAFRWFREKHGLFVAPAAASYENGLYLWFFEINSTVLPFGTGLGTTDDFKTYEEAETACLQKLIEIVEQTHAEMIDHGVYK
jgi:hypothetical protein